MRIVVALGGNALLRRGEALTSANQLANIRRAASQLARIVDGNEVVLTHGNGPQVGLLALQAAEHAAGEGFPLDVLGAQTDGMIGYLLEQELGNILPSRVVATLMTRVQVDPSDPAFASPTKPIGPVYTAAEAERIGLQRGWSMAPDGKGIRRVVASPSPQRVLGLQPIQWLLSHGALVIAAGGGGIPVAAIPPDGSLQGIEAVIDKDLCSSLLARQLQADCLVIATDVDAVYLDFGTPGQRALRQVDVDALSGMKFPAGSMGPKVEAARAFVAATGRRAVIGSLDHIEAMVQGRAGTEVVPTAGRERSA
ncbi:MAG: carbamate kinase [Piscinibacter sp.]|uniref:carbamate kinase n=1 Tax=Piscinibacter TaxID=1114981 RepID=UPI000DD35CA8|nr:MULTISPECIES: carbamate kinase [Piscinibacter]MCW5663796.1 carbamate kinase [Piscinibacter sp.]